MACVPPRWPPTARCRAEAVGAVPYPARHQALVFTCAWGGRFERTRQLDLVDADPDATFWRRDQSDPTEDLKWTHLWVNGYRWSAGGLDPVLALVSDDRTSGVIIAPTSRAWLHHPCAGGADGIAPDEATRDRLADENSDWLSARPERL